MSLKVLVTFPGKMKLAQFAERINLLREMGCKLHVDPSEEQVSKAKAARDFNAAFSVVKKVSAFQVAEALTPEEEKLLDMGLDAIYKKGTSPLLDFMTEAGVGKLKPNMSHEIVSYYKENPGHTTAQGAGELAERFQAHYQDVNDAFVRIRNLINTMCHAKGNQKHLEKRNGFVGRGGAAQVYAI